MSKDFEMWTGAPVRNEDGQKGLCKFPKGERIKEEVGMDITKRILTFWVRWRKYNQRTTADSFVQIAGEDNMKK